MLRLQVEPAAGKLAGLTLLPPLADVTLVNEVRMGRGCTARARWQESPTDAAQRELRVTGNWGRGCGQYSQAFALLSDSDLTARAIGALWIHAGGVLGGHVVDRVVAARPLSDSSPKAPQKVKTDRAAAVRSAAVATVAVTDSRDQQDQ